MNIFNKKISPAYLMLSVAMFGCAGESPQNSSLSSLSSQHFDPSSLDSVSSVESYGLGAAGSFDSSRVVIASVETYLKYAEAVGLTSDGGASISHDDSMDLLGGNIHSNGRMKIQDIAQGSESSSEVIDRILDKGYIIDSAPFTSNCNATALSNLVKEDGSAILTYMDSVLGTILIKDSTPEVLDRILDKGAVIDMTIEGEGSCVVNYRLVIASVETYLKYAEAVR